MERDNRRIRGVKPTGPLQDMLKEYQAPEGAQERIARRAGNLAGNFLPISSIKSIIEDSMHSNSGLPNWESVDQSVGRRVNDVYRKMKR